MRHSTRVRSPYKSLEPLEARVLLTTAPPGAAPPAQAAVADVARSVTPFQTFGTPPLLFDEVYYLATYPDVLQYSQATGVSGWEHFQLAGQFEGRNPSPYFETHYYLNQNPDVASAYANGLIPSPFYHFLAAGQQEGRPASVFFNERTYRQLYPDVAQAIAFGALTSGLEHFLAAGQYEDRQPIIYFDPGYYRQTVLSGISESEVPSAYENYLTSGRFALASPTPFYEEEIYQDFNPDVYAAPANSPRGFEHFLRAGLREQRIFSDLFSESSYLTKNPDVAAAVTLGQLESGLEHYLLIGYKENRPL